MEVKKEDAVGVDRDLLELGRDDSVEAWVNVERRGLAEDMRTVVAECRRVFVWFDGPC